MKTRKTCNIEVHQSIVDYDMNSTLDQMRSLGYRLEDVDISIDGSYYSCELSFFRNVKPKYPIGRKVSFYGVYRSKVDEMINRVDKMMALVCLKRVDQDIDIDSNFATGVLEYENVETGSAKSDEDDSGRSSIMSLFFSLIAIASCIGFLIMLMLVIVMNCKNSHYQSVNDKYEMLTTSPSTPGSN